MTDQVQADAPVADAPKERKPRTPKDPRDFGTAAAPAPNFKMPDKDKLAKLDKTGLREVVRKSGRFPVKAASYMKPKEIVAALADEFPFTATPYVGYKDPSDPDGNRVVNNIDELVALAGDRKAAYAPAERARSLERDALRNSVLGELVQKYPGRDKEARLNRLRAILEAKAPYVPLDDKPKRQDQRFYDVDGMAGRRTAYRIAPKDDVKKDGDLKANAAAPLLMSPQVYDELIKDDAELAKLIEVPEGFNVAPKREPKPKDPNAPARKRTSRKRTSDVLDSVDEAVAPVEDPASTTIDDALAADPDIPNL